MLFPQPTRQNLSVRLARVRLVRQRSVIRFRIPSFSVRRNFVARNFLDEFFVGSSCEGMFDVVGVAPRCHAIWALRRSQRSQGVEPWLGEMPKPIFNIEDPTKKNNSNHDWNVNNSCNIDFRFNLISLFFPGNIRTSLPMGATINVTWHLAYPHRVCAALNWIYHRWIN